MAALVCRLMLGYFFALNFRICTFEERVQRADFGFGLTASGGGTPPLGLAGRAHGHGRLSQ
jgi:hypothetical protein